MTLEQNFTWSLSALREYGHASDIEVLKKDAIKFHERSDPALVTRIERTIFINKDDIIFHRLKLDCASGR